MWRSRYVYIVVGQPTGCTTDAYYSPYLSQLKVGMDGVEVNVPTVAPRRQKSDAQLTKNVFVLPGNEVGPDQIHVWTGTGRNSQAGSQ